MAFTRDGLKKMKEAELRTQVLIPLFSAMGFRDVFHYHGGPGEQGKDLVMWKPDELRHRINYAVVAKAGRITGQATASKSSANEVCFQITQAFGTAFKDPVTGEDRLVDGDRLWKHVEKHLPESNALEKLSQVEKCFEEMDPHYRIGVSTIGGKRNISIEPKYPGAEIEHPLTVNLDLAFLSDPEGQSTQTDYDRHIKAGTPVTISKRFINKLDLPPLLKRIIGDETAIEKITLGPRKLVFSLPIIIEAIGADGASMSLGTIQLSGVRAGTDEITFSNSEQAVPWKVDLVINQPKQHLHFSLQIISDNENVHQQYNILKFVLAVSKKGYTRIVDENTGSELFRIPHPLPVKSGANKDPPPQFILEIFEKLDLIQSRSGTILIPPKGPIQPEQIIAICNTAEAIKNGKLVVPVKTFKVHWGREFAEIILRKRETTNNAPDQLIMTRPDEKNAVFGKEIPMGNAVVRSKSVNIPDSSASELKQQLADPTQTRFCITFDAVGESPLEFYYPKWIPSGETIPFRFGN